MSKPVVSLQFTKQIKGVSFVRFLVVREIEERKGLFIYGDQECTVGNNGELTPQWERELDTRTTFPTVDDALAEFNRHLASTQSENWKLVPGMGSLISSIKG